VLFVTPEDVKCERERVIAYCADNKIKTLVAPQVDELDGAGGGKSRIREIRIEDLLGREEIQINKSEVYEAFHDKVVMVGGSMMYIDAVCKGLDEMPDIPEPIRQEVRAQYAEHGLLWLQEQVRELDPTYWAEVDQQNPRRLMHCVEVCRASGKAYSAFRRGGNQAKRREDEGGFDVEYIMVERPREELYERINQRVHKMVADGLLDEARRAFEKMGVDLGERAKEQEGDQVLPNSLNTVGYKELLPYFRGEYSLERAIELIQQNSRHYAKRQMTWWRKQFNALPCR
jgi:tRNA dimethylallyltransferase